MLEVTQTVSHQILIGVDLRCYSGICFAGLWMTTDRNSNCIMAKWWKELEGMWKTWGVT